ncbi:hypothetical protein AB0K52_22560 [Glycomyces sp. NPDC049804]|uniref:hypothetical protein n=1 Tax=Glycomyces sp. NPDC049804 TaxID=3154363 RepID=UPI003438D999
MTLEQYWDKSDDELYELLGAALQGEGLGLGPSDRRRHRKFGREWFEKRHRELQRRICHDRRLQGFLGSSRSDRLVDAAAIYEVLQQIGEDVVAIPLLSVLIARVGLSEFCKSAPELT